MSQGAWRNDTVTQMNQMKDSRMFKIELEKNNVKLKAADRRQLKSDIRSMVRIFISV